MEQLEEEPIYDNTRSK